MAISLDELKHLAELARLRLSDDELTSMQADLNRVLDHFQRLRELDLAGVELTPHSVDVESIWREDTQEGGLSREDALDAAPEVRAGLFLVPTIIE